MRRDKSGHGGGASSWAVSGRINIGHRYIIGKQKQKMTNINTRPIIWPEIYDGEFAKAQTPYGWQFIESVITDPKIIEEKTSGYFYVQFMFDKGELRVFYIP